MLDRLAALALVALLAVPATLVPCDCCGVAAPVEPAAEVHGCCQPSGPVLDTAGSRCCLTMDEPGGGATTLPGSAATVAAPSSLPHPAAPTALPFSRRAVVAPSSHFSPRPALRI